MARLTVEDCWWTDPRRDALTRILKSADLADIAAVRAWRLAQEFWKHDRKPVPDRLFNLLPGASALLEVGLAEVREDGVYISGSSAYLEWLNVKREAGKKGGLKSADKRRKSLKSGEAKRKQTQADSSETEQVQPSYSYSSSSSFSDSSSVSVKKENAQPSENAEIDGEASKGGNLPDGVSSTALAWRSYRDAFAEKYGSPPPWNAKIAGQLKSFVSRIPAEAAPGVAAFYLTHPGARYAAAMHPVGLLLMDAEKLYTEWQTGRTVTATGAKQSDKFGHAAEQIRRIREGTL